MTWPEIIICVELGWFLGVMVYVATGLSVSVDALLEGIGKLAGLCTRGALALDKYCEPRQTPEPPTEAPPDVA